MAKSSDYTKKARTTLWALRITDYVLLLAPIFYYLGYGLFCDGLTYQKVSLIGCFAIALVLVIFNIIARKHLRSPIWILLIGIYVAVDNIMPLIICLAITSVLDEFLFMPLIANAKTKLIANKAIDQRG